jgi:putative serine protease PepD
MTDDELPGDGDADDARSTSGSGGRPSPLGRAWVHPSELPALDAPFAATRPSRERSAAGATVRTLSVPVLSGLVGAALALAVAAAIGAFDRPTRVQVVERASDTSASSAPAATSDDLERVAEIATQAMPALVRVKVAPEAGGGTGTGLTVLPGGIVLTSSDLVGEASSVEIVDAGGRTHTADVLGRDPESGLAVLRADADDLVVADLAEQGPSQVGETAIVVGAPSGYQTSGSVAVGVISGINRVVVTSDARTLYGMLEIDRPIPTSACGGAVLDRAGKVVAVPVSWPVASAPAETLSSRTGDDPAGATAGGLAVPIDQALDVTQQILRNGRVEHAWLGVGGDQLRAAAATRMGVGGGVLVTNVVPGSPAEQVGVLPADVITAVDGVAISDMPSLLALVRSKGVGTEISLTVMRMEDAAPVTLTVTATLVDKPS